MTRPHVAISMTKTRLMMRAATELSKDERRWHTSSPSTWHWMHLNSQKAKSLGFFQETTTSPRMILQVGMKCIYVYMYISYHNSISLMLENTFCFRWFLGRGLLKGVFGALPHSAVLEGLAIG